VPISIFLADNTGSSATTIVTSDDSVAGTADPNAVVALSDGSNTLGTVQANARGIWLFTPTGLADGPHTVTATETNGSTTGSASLSFTLSLNDLSGVVTLTSIGEAVETKGTAATFSDANINDAASDFTATVDWGDGTTEAGSVTGQNGSFTVAVPNTNHFYIDEGNVQPVVTITRTTDNDQITLTGMLNVTESDALTPHSAMISAQPGQVFVGTVATFTDTNVNNVANDFTATINWGDGTTATGVVTDSDGQIGVSGTHTYAKPGTDNLLVTLTEDGPGTAAATAVSTAGVVNPIIHPPPPPADFTGSGTSDVLLQDGGTVVDWIMNNGQYQAGNVLTKGDTLSQHVATGY
jgi:hypothetical protein